MTSGAQLMRVGSSPRAWADQYGLNKVLSLARTALEPWERGGWGSSCGRSTQPFMRMSVSSGQRSLQSPEQGRGAKDQKMLGVLKWIRLVGWTLTFEADVQSEGDAMLAVCWPVTTLLAAAVLLRPAAFALSDAQLTNPNFFQLQ